MEVSDSLTSISTFTRAISRGFIHGITTLTASLVRKFPPLSLSSSYGHLDLLRKGLASPRRLIASSITNFVVCPSVPSPRTSARLVPFPLDSPRLPLQHVVPHHQAHPPQGLGRRRPHRLLPHPFQWRI